MAPFTRLFFLLCILKVVAGARLAGQHKAGGGGEKADPVLGLFNLNDNSKLWDEDLLVKTMDELQKPMKFYSGNTELEYYSQQGTIAAYMGLEHVEAIYLPVPINFIFVGFSGEGNHGLRLGEEELRRWFEHMDHLLEHTRVPQDADTWKLAHHLPRVSYTHYNYTVHALEMGQRVATVFEQAIRSLSRPLDPSDARGEDSVWYQVDMEGMSQVVDSFVRHLELDAGAYNVFVLNPNRHKTRPKYGYRYGLSEAEMELILKDEKLRLELSDPRLEKSHDYLTVHDTVSMPLFDKRPGHKFSYKDVQHYETAHWVTKYEKLLEGYDAGINHHTDAVKNAHAAARQIVTSQKAAKRGVALKKVLREGMGPQSGWVPDCLVDTFVGDNRWALIDLSAGPFTWGPVVGGQGVRTETSLPSVDKFFRDLASTPPVTSDEDLERELERMSDERFDSIDEDATHEVDMLLAEMDVYEIFARKHCAGTRSTIPICKELQDRLDAMKEELAKHVDSRKDPLKSLRAHQALLKLQDWKLLANQAPLHVAETRNVSRAWDMFLADMAALLASSMQHVVTPSTADGAFHFYDKVAFHIYLVTPQEKKRSPFDVAELKDALQALQLPGQQFQFSIHKLSLADDPTLAMAYSGALRFAMVPTLLPNGSMVAHEQAYLDSAYLQDQLRTLGNEHLHRSRKSARAQQRAFREVPIFVFADSSSEGGGGGGASAPPVLIDSDGLAAKAMPDMVLAVQLAEPHWPTQLQCNGNALHSDLREPNKEIVRAVLHHMAGLLPSHISFSSSHAATAYDWRWSVGGHPLSQTSPEHQVAAFQRDTVARSFIVTALDESIEALNAGIALLATESTHIDTYKAFKAQRERHLLADYNHVVELWKQIAELVEELKLADAARLLASLEEKSKSFHAFAKETTAALHPLRCTRQRRLQVGFGPLMGVVCVALVALLVLVLRPRRLKPKVN